MAPYDGAAVDLRKQDPAAGKALHAQLVKTSVPKGGSRFVRA